MFSDHNTVPLDRFVVDASVCAFSIALFVLGQVDVARTAETVAKG